MQREDYQPVSNSNELQGWTNNVLVLESNEKIQLYLPAYLRSKLKNIVSLDSSTGIGLLNSVVILSIYYDRINDIFPGILQQLQSNVILRFKIDPLIKLSGGFVKFVDNDGEERSTYITKKIDEKQRLITFCIRKLFAVHLVSHVFWSPFEYIQYVNTIALESIKLKDFQKKIKINFNLMDFNKQDKFSVVSYTHEGALGQFDLAGSLISAQFSNQRFYSKDLHTQLKSKVKSRILHKPAKSNENQQDQSQVFNGKIQSFNFGHAVYPVYRRPLVPLFNLFFPVAILGLINLAIFFQDNTNLGKKIINIAALLASYLYFLPIVREKIPPSSSLTITEIILFSMASLTLLTYYHSISVRGLQEYEFVWNQEILFQIALIVTLLIIATLVIISLVFAFCLSPTYNSKKGGKEEKFDKVNWSNLNCDYYFQKIREAGFRIVQISNYMPDRNKHSSKKKR